MPSGIPISQETIDRAAKFWAQGQSLSVIAEDLGVSKGTISSLSDRRRDLFPSRLEVAITPWSAERADEAARLWAMDLSATEIGKALGVNKSAVLGYVHRNRARFPSRGTGRPREPAAISLPKIKAAATVAPKRVKTVVRTAVKPAPTPKPKAKAEPETIRTSPPAPKPRVDAWKPLAGTAPAGLMRVCGCRWPVECEDDRFIKAATYFCDAPRTWKTDRHGKARQSSYCGTHDAMSIGSGTPSERAAVRELARAVG